MFKRSRQSKTHSVQSLLKLLHEQAPHRRHFLHYIDSRFYHGTIFHRVIPDFMIWDGGF